MKGIYHVQKFTPSSGTQPDFLTVRNEGSFPRGKAAGHKVGLSPAVGADVKNKGICNPASLICLQSMSMGTMTFIQITTCNKTLPGKSFTAWLCQYSSAFSGSPQTHDHLHKT